MFARRQRWGRGDIALLPWKGRLRGRGPRLTPFLYGFTKAVLRAGVMCSLQEVFER